MDFELKRTWLDALRGGKYEQGLGMLACNNQFCCLGVLCDIISKEIGSTKVEVLQVEAFDADGALARVNQTCYDGAAYMISLRLRAIAQITRQEAARLAKMNDEERMSFDQIADYIEEHL